MHHFKCWTYGRPWPRVPENVTILRLKAQFHGGIDVYACDLGGDYLGSGRLLSITPDLQFRRETAITREANVQCRGDNRELVCKTLVRGEWHILHTDENAGHPGPNPHQYRLHVVTPGTRIRRQEGHIWVGLAPCADNPKFVKLCLYGPDLDVTPLRFRDGFLVARGLSIGNRTRGPFGIALHNGCTQILDVMSDLPLV